MKKVVTFGGGTGQFNILRGLKKISDLEITAIASMVDSGGSTGRLRDERIAQLPPSDIYRCILALSPYEGDPETREMLLYRFNIEGKLKGHTVGNMIMTMLANYSGNFLEAVKAISEWLKIKGEVLPVTLSNVHLIGETESGRIISGEAKIGARSNQEPFKRLFLAPEAETISEVLDRIVKADFIIVGPGDLLTSLLPNFLVKGIPEAIRKSKAKKIYLVNIMTRYAETHNFNASDHTLYLEKYLGTEFNLVVSNAAKPVKEVLERYKKEKAIPVEVDIRHPWGGREAVKVDLLASGVIARHDPDKVAQLFKKIFQFLK